MRKHVIYFHKIFANFYGENEQRKFVHLIRHYLCQLFVYIFEKLFVYLLILTAKAMSTHIAEQCEK